MPGGDFVNKVGFLASVVALLSVLIWLYERGTGRKIGKDHEGGKGRRTNKDRGDPVLITRDLLDELIARRVDERLRQFDRSPPTPAWSGEAADYAASAKAGIETVAAEGGDAGARALAKAKESGDFQAIESVLERLAEADAAQGAASNRRAAERFRELGALAFLNDTGKALRAYARAGELDPEDYEGLFQLGRLQSRSGNLPAAKRTFESVLMRANSIDDPRLLLWTHFFLGDVETAMANRAAALTHYERGQAQLKALIADDPNNAEGQRDLSVSYDRVGDIRQAKGDRDGAESL